MKNNQVGWHQIAVQNILCYKNHSEKNYIAVQQ